MFKYLLRRGVITFHENANQWIYQLQKLPLIGTHISDSWYSQMSLKTAFGILGMLWSLFWSFCGKVMYFLFFLLLPMLGTTFVWYPEDLGAPEGLATGLILFYFCLQNLLYGSLANGQLFSVEEEDFVMLSHFHVPARQYLLGDVLWNGFLDAALLSLLLCFPLGAKGLVLGLLRFACRIIGEGANLALFAWKRIDTTKLVKTRLVAMALAAVLGFGLPFLLGPKRLVAFGRFFTWPVVLALTAVVTAVAALVWIRMSRYRGYSYLAKLCYTYDRVQEVEQIVEANLKAEIEISDQAAALTEKEKKRLSKLSGYHYLNALFFCRHKKLLSRSSRNKQIIVAGVGAGLLAVAALLFPADIKENIWNLLNYQAPGFLVFLMYCMANGQRTCKAFFFHCDESLLKYGYYRQPGVLLQNFRIRMRYVVTLELQWAAVLAAVFLAAPFVLGYGDRWYELLPLAAETVLLAVFFAGFHLFCYYVFQPYTSAATVKHPVFSALNGFLYIICYLCLQLDVVALWFPLAVLAVIAVFLPVAFWAIYRFAPKTFRVRG